MQTGAAKGSCLLDSSFAVQEQFFHLRSPGLLLLFLQEGQVPQMMHVAERMLAHIQPIRPPAIMHTHPRQSLSGCRWPPEPLCHVWDALHSGSTAPSR